MAITANRPTAGRSRGSQGAATPWVDNGAMIAWLGLLKLRAEGPVDVADSAVRPYQRTDQVEVTWR